MLADPDGNTLRYEKNHLFDMRGRTNITLQGSTPLTIEVEGLDVAFLCFDLRFAPDFLESCHSGTDMFIVVANWPEAAEIIGSLYSKQEQIENQAFVLGVKQNRRRRWIIVFRR